MLFGSIDVHAVLTATLLVIAGLAVREDLLRQRIPNALNAAGLATGLVLSAFIGGPAGFTDSICGALLGGATLLPFYLLRAMGAGDVKFMAAAGSFLGPESALLGAAVALIAGAVLALALIAWRLVETKSAVGGIASVDGVAAGSRTAIRVALKERFPYALAIAIGVAGVLWWQGSLGALLAALGGG